MDSVIDTVKAEEQEYSQGEERPLRPTRRGWPGRR